MPGLLDSNPSAEVRPTAMPAPKKPTGSGKMSMALVNFWLDAALFVNMIFIMWVSVMLQLVFPPPTQATGWTLWGLSFDEWHKVQFFSLCVFALLAVEHLVLHWNWVCSVIATQVLHLKKRPDEGAQPVYGVGTFIVILIFMLGGLIVAMATAKYLPH